MNELPFSLFLLPSEGSTARKRLELYLDSKSEEISVYLPWLSSEILVTGGSKRFLKLIEKEGSKRISITRISKYIEMDERLERIIVQNSNYCETVDIQSISGFIECLRKYCVASLIKNKKTSNEIVGQTGVSIRTIQRINSKIKEHSTRHFCISV